MSVSSFEVNLDQIKQPPTPEQIFKIVAIGMDLAKEQGSIQQGKRGKTHVFLPSWVEEEAGQGKTYRATTHKYLGLIAKKGFSAWGLRLREGVYVTEDQEWVKIPTAKGLVEGPITNRQVGYTNNYIFEWNKHRVTQAVKTTHLVRNEYDPHATQSSVPAGFESLIGRLQAISMAECIELTDRFTEFSERSRELSED